MSKSAVYLRFTGINFDNHSRLVYKSEMFRHQSRISDRLAISNVEDKYSYLFLIKYFARIDPRSYENSTLVNWGDLPIDAGCYMPYLNEYDDYGEELEIPETFWEFEYPKYEIRLVNMDVVFSVFFGEHDMEHTHTLLHLGGTQ